MVNCSWLHSSLLTQASHQPLLLDLLLCLSISHNSTVLEQSKFFSPCIFSVGYRDSKSVLQTYLYIIDTAMHVQSAPVALYVYVSVREYLNSLRLLSLSPFRPDITTYYCREKLHLDWFWFLFYMWYNADKYSDTCVSNKMQVIKKEFKKLKAPWLEVVNLFRAHCRVSM